MNARIAEVPRRADTTISPAWDVSAGAPGVVCPCGTSLLPVAVIATALYQVFSA